MTANALAKMREACVLAAEALCMVGDRIGRGVSTDEINAWVHDYLLSHDARPSPLNYNGYPKSVCTSINEVVCHGIPSERKVQDGDIVNVDITCYYPKENGFHGDTSATFYIGTPNPVARRLVEVTRECLERGVLAVREEARLGDIGHAIQSHAEAEGFSVVRDFVGHGIGREFHMPPQVAHFGKAGTGKRLKAGMVFTIEPMINEGVAGCNVLEDGWTAVTDDGRLSAQFEHTIVVTKEGCEVLSARKRILVASEDKPWVRPCPITAPFTVKQK